MSSQQETSRISRNASDLMRSHATRSLHIPNIYYIWDIYIYIIYGNIYIWAFINIIQGLGAQITICVCRGAHEKRLGTTGLMNSVMSIASILVKICAVIGLYFILLCCL